MHVPRPTTSRGPAARSPYDPHHIGGELDQTVRIIDLHSKVSEFIER
jgi:hypothetical protein